MCLSASMTASSVLLCGVCVCCAGQVGWISIQSSNEPVIQFAQFGPESNQGSHLVTNQGPGCDVTTKEIWVPWELGGVNAMNHTGPLCCWSWIVGAIEQTIKQAELWRMRLANCAADQYAGSLKLDCCDLCACQCGMCCVYASSLTSKHCGQQATSLSVTEYTNYVI